MRAVNLFSLVVVVIRMVGRNGIQKDTTNRISSQQNMLPLELIHRLKVLCLEFMTTLFIAQKKKEDRVRMIA